MCRKLLFGAILAVCLITAANAIETANIIQRAIDGPVAYEPVPLDIQEDMIAYDAAPAVYFPNLDSVGTMIAVRFTPVQACTLTYIQVVSYSGAGNASIHIMNDDGGNPGTDMITPWTASLTGNLSYQRINLPSRLNVGEHDFHIAVQYMQAPPPFVTADNNGGTENRSKYKAPADQTWTAFPINDVNFRAFVVYYGSDAVPPTISHIPQVLGFTYDTGHVITAQITDGSGVASAAVHYSTDGLTWDTVAMANTSGDTWEGTIPHQEAGTTVLYYISAIDASSNSNEALDPPTAPGTPYVMEIVEGAEIAYDDGSPDGWWIVGDVFDDNAFAIRMTPDSYPAQVIMARAYVSDETPFDFTINGVTAGLPGNILPGGGPIEGVRNETGWAMSGLENGPTIQSGNFFLVFHWRQATPTDPAVGEDTNNILFRSYWYNATSGWTMISTGEYMLRCVVVTPTGIKELGGDGVRPASYQLVGNYPNPFNPSTDIKFLAPQAGNVRIDIYNISGQLVKTVLDGYVEAGVKAVTWDGTNSSGMKVNSGIYLYKLTAGDYVETQKMVLMK